MEQVFNPRRLDKALTYRCKSVSELAEKTNIARQYISGYRNGKLVPKVEQVKIIADVLEMPRRFFYEKDYTESISPVYFRSQLTTRKAYREYQKIKIEFTEQLYKFLSDYIEFPALNLPDFGVVTPKEAAKRLREHWGLGNEPIENIITVVENNGIIVSCCGTNTDAIDAFSKKVILEDGTKTFFIGYSENKKAAARIHFDIAHELGHICLHGWYDSDELDKETFISYEQQANDFAAEFLLPEETFGQDSRRTATTILAYKKLKRKWVTSIAAMIRRSCSLGIVTYDVYQKMMITMSKRGKRKEEPLDDELLTAEPSLLRTAVMLLLNNNVFEPAEFVSECNKELHLTLFPKDVEELLGLPNGTLVKTKILDFTKMSIKEFRVTH